PRITVVVMRAPPATTAQVGHRRWRWIPRTSSTATGRAAVAPEATGIQVTLQAFQVGAKLGGRLVTEGGIFLQRLVENIFKGQGQSGIQLRRRNRRRMQDASENEGSGRAGKWNHARGHLRKHSAKRKQ